MIILENNKTLLKLSELTSVWFLLSYLFPFAVCVAMLRFLNHYKNESRHHQAQQQQKTSHNETIL